MARQYIRKYELTISPVDADSRIIKDLRVSFEVTKSTLSWPNLCRISIFNPNQDTISAIESKYTQIILNAGYEGSMGLIFKGEIRNGFISKTKTDKIVTLYAGDGEKDWQNSFFNRTYSESVSMRQVIADVIATFKNTSQGALEGLPETADKLLGQTISGSSKDVLDGFAKEYGFTWSIQDGELVTTPLEEPLQGDEAVVLNAKTGMINSPTITENGVNVTCLLNPKLLPNRAIKIESLGSDASIGNLYFYEVKATSGEGTYKIEEVTFSGDSREGDWLSSIKARRI